MPSDDPAHPGRPPGGLLDAGRRRFLLGAGAAGALATVARPVARAAAPPTGPFRWGVASFDPSPDGVLLWTRVDPALGEDVALTLEVATDEALGEVVARRTATVGAATDHCATVALEGLAAGTTHWYRFALADGSAAGPVGRTRTTPTDPDRFRIALVSCARYATDGWGAYAALAGREVDLVVHVGDYLYEDGRADARAHDPPRRCTTLADYRTRYAQYRSDPALQALHARHPMVHTWDDHESAGNAWRDGAVSHDDARDGPWPDRLAAASQALLEWVPGGERAPDGRLRRWRTVPLGPLAELLVLDTRTWGRERQARTAEELRARPDRSLLGADQAAWLRGRLRAEDRRPWTLLANQVMFHPLRVPSLGDSLDAVVDARSFLDAGDELLNPDQWDGYPDERDAVVAAAGDRGGVVVLTGDVHSSWAWDGPALDGTPGIVEAVAPSVSSSSFADGVGLATSLVEPALRLLDEDLAFVELSRHGYVVLDGTPEAVQAEWWFVDPDDPATEELGAALRTPRPAPMGWTPADGPTEDPRPASRPATTGPDAGSADPASTEAADDGPPVVALGAGALAVAAGAAALVAARRRGQRRSPSGAEPDDTPTSG